MCVVVWTVALLINSTLLECLDTVHKIEDELCARNLIVLIEARVFSCCGALAHRSVSVVCVCAMMMNLKIHLRNVDFLYNFQNRTLELTAWILQELSTELSRTVVWVQSTAFAVVEMCRKQGEFLYPPLGQDMSNSDLPKKGGFL